MRTWPTTANDVISKAMLTRGMGEIPPGSNRNAITRWYGEVGPWCAMAVAYWFHMAGVNVRSEFNCPGWAATTEAADAAKRAGAWRQGHAGMQRGDIVFYRLAGGDPGYVNHTGIVTVVGNLMQAIEGNMNNQVAVTTRGYGEVVGYIRPPYRQPLPTAAAPTYPGRDKLKLGAKNDYVTQLDRQLVRLGYTKHNDGVDGYNPGPAYTQYTAANVKDFQHAQGWTGADADGNAGPVTWRLLFTTPTPKA